MGKKQAPSINKDGIVRELTEIIREDSKLDHLQGIRLTDVSRIVGHFITVIENNLMKGLHVKLVGFGTIFPHKRPAREANKPTTKDKIQVNESWVAKFTCGNPLMTKLTNNFSDK